MAETQLFQKLLPVNIKFFQGESPSPTKLNGIFNYIQASYYVLESFLGNGIDYGVTVLKNRKMVFNLSSTIGQAGNLYKPTNRLGSLTHIHRFFSALHNDSGEETTFGDSLHSEHANYVEGDGVLGEYLEILDQINIPINIQGKNGENFQFGIVYKGSGVVRIVFSDFTYEEINCSAPAQDELKIKTTITTESFINHISFIPTADFKVFSTWLVETTETLLTDDSNFANLGEKNTFNVGCAIPVDNGLDGNEAFWKIGSPCVHSLDTATNKCDKRTSSYCMGNTYDIYVDQTNTGTPWAPVGQPICAGNVGLTIDDLYKGEISSDLMPKNDLAEDLKYTPIAYDASSVNVILTIQSCLLMKSKPYMTKFRPFAAHNLISGGVLTKNESCLYDLSANYNPIKYDITLRSAGRPDILYVLDTKRALEEGTYNQVSVIGGSYNISAMLKDILTHVGERETPQPAVYSD